MTRTETLLAAYPDARTKFPGWFEQSLRCAGCKKAPYLCKCGINGAEYERHGKFRCIAPDLTLEENLHHLLALADAVNGFPVAMFWNRKDKHNCALAPFADGPCVGAGPTRTDAVLNALEKALGVKV